MTCPHPAAEPVDVVGLDGSDEVTTVAWLCTSCRERVRPGEVDGRCWSCDWVAEQRFCDPNPVLVLAQSCDEHREWRP